MSEIKVGSIKGLNAKSAAISIDNSSGTCTANLTAVNGGQLGGRNLLINGDMRINQRFGSASMNATNANLYSLDRWVTSNDNATSRFTVQQVEDAPVGFYYSLKATSTSAHTPLSGEVFGFSQKIEGYNTNWLEFGTSNAKSITISFFVKSSLTGTFGGSVLNHGMTRGFPYTYTISSANTWEKKTVTVIGCPDGTWDPTDTTGIRVHWSMGAHANRSDTAGQWSSTTFSFHPTGATDVVSTNGATLQVTGCQVEEGNTATLFEHRLFGQELALCRRYFQTSFTSSPSTTNTSNDGVVAYGGGRTGDSTSFLGTSYVHLSPEMRAAPTVTTFDLAVARNTNKCHRFTFGFTGADNQSVTITDVNTKAFNLRSDSGHNANGMAYHYTCEAEL